ncbi:MAG: nucleoside triphosphate pyrophosphohydrolase [Bacillota bacterium]|nr:nucleoside triphosphate pyrophosphohydrolase [Bacillota bacterium]
MHTITVVPLGPGSPDLLTLGAFNHLKKAAQIILRTQKHRAVKFLSEEGLVFESLDSLYESSEDFDTFALAAVERLLNAAEKGAVAYAVTDPAQDATVRLLRDRVPDHVRVLPGVSLSASFVQAAMPAMPVLVSSAVDLPAVNAQQALCVVELDSRVLAGEVKLKLLDRFGDQAELDFFPPGETAARKSVRIPLSELDRQKKYDHTTGFVLYPQALRGKKLFDFEDLQKIMRILRSPEGCPWDREQTHETLAKYLVEEAHEALCAIMEEDWEGTAEELGDVLLQVVFHAVVGEEYGTFNMADVLASICSKLIRRHPHIFGEEKAENSAEVVQIWDQVKKTEKEKQSPGERMLDVPKGLAPFLRAEKVQKLAAKVGFDWEKPEDALLKVHEEADELLSALKNDQEPEAELGDLLFSCVNVARLMGLSVDQSIHKTTEKFIRRFNWMENAIKIDKKALESLTIQELEVYWESSKAEMNDAL